MPLHYHNLKQVIVAQVLLAALFGLIYYLGMHLSFSSVLEGVFPKNYIRQGGWNDYTIIQKDTVFNTPTAARMLSWDAAIYQCMREHLYVQNKNCYDQARLAFYPAFPLLWRLSGMHAIGISVLNFVLLGISTMLISNAYKVWLSWARLLLLFSLPGFVVFLMPYTEALFLFFGALVIFFYKKQHYVLSGSALFFMAITRPAALIYLAAIVVGMLLWLIANRGKNIRWAAMWWLFPFALAWLFNLSVQYAQTGIINGFSSSADALWQGGQWSWPTHISGWTYETFAINALVLTGIMLPAFLFTLQRGWASIMRFDVSKGDFIDLKTLAFFYIAILGVHQFFYTHGSLHGLFRFVLCTPAFFLLAIRYTPNKALLILMGVVSFLLSTSLILNASYTQNAWFPEFNGLPLMALSLVLLFYTEGRSVLSKMAITGLVLLNLLFNAHLYDMFLGNAWVWT